MDLNNIPSYYFIIVGLDFIIMIILLVFLSRTWKNNNQVRRVDELQVQNLKKSLEKVMAESEKMSRTLLEAFDSRIIAVKEIYSKMEEMQVKLDNSIAMARVRQSSIENSDSSQVSSDDKYSRALLLINSGISPSEVQRKCGLNLGEIELITQLVSHGTTSLNS